jgi:predicted nucleotidyltransferase
VAAAELEEGSDSMFPKIKKLEDIFPEIVSDYKNLFSDDLISIILYGSAAGHDYRPGKSDLNFMIVLSDNGIDNIDKALPIIKKWRKKHVAIPLFLTKEYIRTSLDVFPIEYINFQQAHLLVFGENILEGLVFEVEHVRLQCEREIKGKLLLLRQAFLETEGKERGLKTVINESLVALLAIFEALLYLKQIDIPKRKHSLIQTMAREFDISAELFEKLLDVKEVKLNPKVHELREMFQQLLGEVRELSVLINIADP